MDSRTYTVLERLHDLSAKKRRNKGCLIFFGIRSCDLRANERPTKNHMGRGQQTQSGTDIATLWKNRPRADFLKMLFFSNAAKPLNSAPVISCHTSLFQRIRKDPSILVWPTCPSSTQFTVAWETHKEIHQFCGQRKCRQTHHLQTFSSTISQFLCSSSLQCGDVSLQEACGAKLLKRRILIPSAVHFFHVSCCLPPFSQDCWDLLHQMGRWFFPFGSCTNMSPPDYWTGFHCIAPLQKWAFALDRSRGEFKCLNNQPTMLFLN